MNIAVIGDRETVVGFSLAGVSLRFIVDDIISAEKALSAVMDRGNVAVLIMTERYARLLENEIDRWREDHPIQSRPVDVDYMVHRAGGKIHREKP